MTDSQIPRVHGYVQVNPETMTHAQLTNLVYAMLKMVDDATKAMEQARQNLDTAVAQRQAAMDMINGMRDLLVSWYNNDDPRVSAASTIDKMRVTLFGH